MPCWKRLCKNEDTMNLFKRVFELSLLRSSAAENFNAKEQRGWAPGQGHEEHAHACHQSKTKGPKTGPDHWSMEALCL